MQIWLWLCHPPHLCNDHYAGEVEVKGFRWVAFWRQTKHSNSKNHKCRNLLSINLTHWNTNPSKKCAQNVYHEPIWHKQRNSGASAADLMTSTQLNGAAFSILHFSSARSCYYVSGKYVTQTSVEMHLFWEDSWISSLNFIKFHQS